MTDTETFDRLVAEAMAASFAGWDFTYLNGRKTGYELPWDYGTTAKERMNAAASMLDLGTGGGEILASLAPFPPHVCATESYGPNIAVARGRLEPLGVKVYDTSADPENHHLPFADEEFHLIINRHDEYIPSELFRVMKTGGRFVTQQCGGYGELDLIEWFRGKDAIEPMDWTATIASQQLETAGFQIIDTQEVYPTYSFLDVGAVVYYLRALPWLVEGFSAEKYRDCLLAMHEDIQEHGRFTVTDQRFFIEAAKPLFLVPHC